MNQANNISPAKSALKLVCGLGLVLVLTPQARAQSSWLDRPLANWNRQAASLPQLPQPPTLPGQSANADRCRGQQVRKPASAAEKALVRRGWQLYGPVYSYDSTTIVTALSGFDGMCRPLGYQAFVYWDGRYAGTLSPEPMNSRQDGALTNIHLSGPAGFSADFARYRESDALCCPSRVGSVAYTLKRDDIPTLAPAEVTHIVPCPPGVPTNLGPGAALSGLFGKRWTLTEMEDRKFSAEAPNIEFDRERQRVSGSSGCNRFTGDFQANGSLLTFSPMAGTKRACIDTEVQRVETVFLKLLATTTRFEVQGNTLRLFADEAPTLSFAGK